MTSSHVRFPEYQSRVSWRVLTAWSCANARRRRIDVVNRTREYPQYNSSVTIVTARLQSVIVPMTDLGFCEEEAERVRHPFPPVHFSSFPSPPLPILSPIFYPFLFLILPIIGLSAFPSFPSLPFFSLPTSPRREAPPNTDRSLVSAISSPSWMWGRAPIASAFLR